ncbi:SIMPL domain-containing protein [Bacteriovoracaceae bacterium]|nr:SIMPL domain-containing protein [Bacteriovoracaceae bacterium]
MKFLFFLLTLSTSQFLNAKYVNNSIESYISVQGQCRKSVMPDQASITVTVKNEDKNLKTAYHKTVTTYEKLQNEIKKEKFENMELQTINTSVSKEHDWIKGKKHFRGHLAKMGIKITTSQTKKISNIIPIAEKLNISNLSNLIFGVSKNLQKKIQGECLKVAVKDARTKARKIANALQLSFDTKVQITELATNTPGYLPRPMPMHEMSSLMQTKSQKTTPPTIHNMKNEIVVTVLLIQSVKH